MPAGVRTSVRIVPDAASGTERNKFPEPSAKTDTVPREKRIAQEIAYQITPRIRRALAGEVPGSLLISFDRKGFRDGITVIVSMVPRRAHE